MDAEAVMIDIVTTDGISFYYMPTIQFRIDEKTKKDSQRIFEQLGLDTSAAIKMYLKQVVARKGIPFRVLTENGLTLEQEDEILRRSAEARRGKNVVSFESMSKAIRYLKT